MSFCRTFQRGPSFVTNGSRFCFYLLFVPFLVHSQDDSTTTVAITAETKYFDVFRQRSENSNTTILVRESYASVSAKLGNDSLTLSASSSDQYAGFSAPASHFSASLQNSLRTLDCSYAHRFSFLEYSLAVGMVLNFRSRPLYYKTAIAASPFDEVFGVEFEMKRSPYRYGTSVSFYDFYVPLDDAAHSTVTSFAIHSKPFSDLLGSLAYSESEGGSSPSATGYGISSSDRYFEKKIFAQYLFSPTANVATEFATEEFRTDIVFYRDNQSFGDVNEGVLRHSRYKVGGAFTRFDLPLTLEYTFDQISTSGAGHFESWPFTTLVESIISNRIIFQYSGLLKWHTLRSSSRFELISMPTKVELSYQRLLTDIVLENWEPEFLTFGMENYTRNPSSIKDIQLLTVALECTFALWNAKITANVEQYIPIALTYREETPVGGLPPPPSESSGKPRTDGGRKFGVRVKVLL